MTAGIAYPADYSSTYSGPQYTANQGRTALSGAMAGATTARPLGGVSGVRPGTPSTTVTATSTTWTAAAFGGYIDTAASATNGGYFFSFPSGGTGSVTAAAASARIDIIYVQLSDVNTGDGTTVAPKVDVLYLAGTAGSGVPPTTPARSFVIAQINVPATGGGSPTVSWVAPYTAAAGGTVMFTTEAALLASTPTPEATAKALDTGRVFTAASGAWKFSGGPRPVVRVLKTGAQATSGTAGNYTPVLFDLAGTGSFDPLAMHSTTVNPSRITVPSGYGGYWRITGHLEGASLSAVMGAAIAVNGTIVAAAKMNLLPSSANFPYPVVDDLLQLNAGDYVEIWCVSNLATVSLTPAGCVFSMEFVGSA